jgi:glutamate-1-semialdehyde 2,1-aminomutase
VLGRLGIPGSVYGVASVFHVFLGAEPPEERRDEAMVAMRGPVGQALRGALVSRGVDILGSGGMLSSTHGDAEIDHTIDAFEASVVEIAAAKKIPGA